MKLALWRMTSLQKMINPFLRRILSSRFSTINCVNNVEKSCKIKPQSFATLSSRTDDENVINPGFGIWKTRGVRQSHTSSQNSEATDVWKVARHPLSRCVVAWDDHSFKNTSFLSFTMRSKNYNVKLKQASKEF